MVGPLSFFPLPDPTPKSPPGLQTPMLILLEEKGPVKDIEKKRKEKKRKEKKRKKRKEKKRKEKKRKEKKRKEKKRKEKKRKEKKRKEKKRKEKLHCQEPLDLEAAQGCCPKTTAQWGVDLTK